ncbi:ATPase inhibitor, mitochondrial-like [Ptychodera flava]|uniref:ATPase inhibitor, mitochondrial-like n=1 Tax=Ptychodera flava TaxID=63121 RepID=UPI00396A2AEA
MALARYAAARFTRNLAVFSQVRLMSQGEYGSGVGKGGGGGGSVREAGGSFGKMEAAHEEQYFRKLQAEQLKSLKSQHDEEIEHHESAIRRHQEAIERHKKRMRQIDDQADDLDSSDSDVEKK